MISRALDRSFVTAENKPSNSERFQACVKRADEEGINLFGMDDKRCWTRDDTEKTYYKFGSSENCSKNNGKASGLTKSLTVFVYQKDDKGEVFYDILIKSNEDKPTQSFCQIQIMNPS